MYNVQENKTLNIEEMFFARNRFCCSSSLESWRHTPFDKNFPVKGASYNKISRDT